MKLAATRTEGVWMVLMLLLSSAFCFYDGWTRLGLTGLAGALALSVSLVLER